MRPPSPLYVPQPGGVLVRGLRAPSAPPHLPLLEFPLFFQVLRTLTMETLQKLN